VNEAVNSDFFDRYQQLIEKIPSATENLPRLRHQYDAFITPNRELFRGSRVLDIMSSYGLWSLAALDAGASHVIGLEDSSKTVEAAKAAFAEYSVDPRSYRFVNSEIPAGLRRLEPKALDLVLCHGFLERSDPRFVFQQLGRLQVKYVILDTRLVRGKGRVARFALRSADAPAGRYKNIMTIPSHDLITFLCDYFQFRWRQIDWQTMGITDWAGLTDYEKDNRRTYVLEKAAAAPKKEKEKEKEKVAGAAQKKEKK